MGRMDGKVALITGGARGQGAAEARLFAAEGASVVLTDVLDADGAQTAAAIGGRYLHHDVTSEARWAEVVADVLDRAGRIDCLVNNAGIFFPKSMVDTSMEDFRRLVDVNQFGVFLGMKAVAGPMITARSGAIVNISSIAGMRGSRGGFAYGATKWAVRGMTKTAAHELGRFGIRVNSIHPGIIDTPMVQQLAGFDAGDTERYQRRIPLGRIAQPEEVAKLALFLASDDSSYSTGSEFIIDGGMTA